MSGRWPARYAARHDRFHHLPQVQWHRSTADCQPVAWRGAVKRAYLRTAWQVGTGGYVRRGATDIPARPARCYTLHWLVGGAALLRTFLQRGLRQRGAECIAEFCNSRRICCRILHSRRAWFNSFGNATARAFNSIAFNYFKMAAGSTEYNRVG